MMIKLYSLIDYNKRYTDGLKRLTVYSKHIRIKEKCLFF